MARRIKKSAPVSAVDRLAIAIGHPLRLRILSALVGGEGSAATLSRQFRDVHLGDVAYHLRVLADDCELIELVRSRPVRGAMESFYRLKAGVDLAGVKLPQPITQGLRVQLFLNFVEVAIAAMDSGSLDRGEETTFSAQPVTVDEQGMAEINEAMREAMERVKRAEAESRRRLKRHKVQGSNGNGVVSAMVGAAAFPAAAPPEPRKAARSLQSSL
jgi:DNA-binding transcriptional ArsR family regulator